jgi:hypothetical protein
MKKMFDGLVEIAMYLIASGFVLMTVTGSVFRIGATLTILGVFVQLAALFIKEEEE